MSDNSTNQVLGSVTPVIENLELLTRTGEEINLVPQLRELVIYEDMYSPVLTGSITLEDNIQLFDRLPIIGFERLRVKVYSYNYSSTLNEKVDFLHRTFDIISVTDITQVNDYTKLITLNFASPELLKNDSTRLSKGLRNLSNSKAVELVLTEDYEYGEGLGIQSSKIYDGYYNNFVSPYMYSSFIECRYEITNEDDSYELFIEKTKYTEPVISFPYMKPFDIVSWLSGRSIRMAQGEKPSTKSAAFLFFENKRGFNFVSLDTLLEAKAYNTTDFVYGDANQNLTKNRNTKSESIINLQIQDAYNTVENIRNGLYASRMYSFDISTGQMREQDYSFKDKFPEFTTMEKNPTLPLEQTLTDRPLSHRILTYNTGNSANNITSSSTARLQPSNKENGPEEYIQNRLMQLGKIGNYVISFEVAGNSKHKVGDCVNIDINTTQPTPDNSYKSVPNLFYSGYYLLTSIKHSITPSQYTMYIEATKDSHNEEIV